MFSAPSDTRNVIEDKKTIADNEIRKWLKIFKFVKFIKISYAVSRKRSSLPSSFLSKILENVKQIWSDLC